MSTDATWNDETREDLRQTLRSLVIGEVRLSKHTPEEIIETCNEAYIAEESPENERQTFTRYAEDELKQAIARHSAEQALWPPVTDTDRLDRVEVTLRDRGICMWQASPCCDTCSVGELGERIEEIDTEYPGFEDCLRGYAFFIDQNMADSLADDTKITVFLAYGWCSPDGSDVEPKLYEKNALSIAREVSDCLREQGFEPAWDGSFSKKIGITLNWQRRTMLQ